MGDDSGTTYMQINAEFPLSDTMTLSAHAGSSSIEGVTGADYEDYSVSLAMDVGNGYSVGIDFIDNSGDGAVGPAFSSGAVISFLNRCSQLENINNFQRTLNRVLWKSR